MIRNLLALIYLLLLPGWLLGQTPNLEDQLGKITIPSATVSSLLKFTDVPVSYYTGTPDISVPIYTINTGKLSLPIILKYSASGIRVAENSSNVGLGWSLSAEGVLQESVLGIPDNNTYHQYGLGWDNAALQSSIPADQALLESLSTGGQDGAPDLYTFSFAGNSGKFIYADVIRTLPQQNLAISTYMNAGNQPEWKIVTQDGTQYFFGIIENTANRSAESITRSRTWYLTKIKDANNTDSITLAYEPTTITEVIGRSYYFYSWRPNAPQPLPFDDDMAPNDPPKPGTYNQIEQISHGWQLKTITWNQGSIEYDLANDRQDMNVGSPRVTNIFLKNKDNEIIKVIHFGQSYFETPNINDAMGKRLKLDDVTFAPDLNSINTPVANKYSFEYNPQALPSKLSNRIDHWGFYNGAAINDSRGLIPSFTYPGMNYYGADRNANPAFTKAAILTKMYYPTGGYAAFTWDVHAKTYPTQVLDSIIVYNDSTITMTLACVGNEELIAEWEDHITIPTTPIDLFGSGVQATWYLAMGTSGQNTMLTVNHADGTGWLNERLTGQPISTTPTIKASKSFSYQATSPYTYQKNVTLLAGKYYGIKGHINHPGFSIEVTLVVKWPKKVANTYTPPTDYLGGCRIGKIVLFDTFTNKTIVKNYDYSTPSFIAVPEYHQPLFKYFYYNNGNPPSGNATDCMYYQAIEGMYVSSNSVHNFNAGVQAGYDWVKETISNGEAGSTIYKFTNFSELSNHGEFPSSWRYGRLLEKSERNSNAVEVRKTTYGNRTVINPAENFAGHTAVRTGAHPCYSPGGIYPVHFDQKVYSFPCDWIYTDTIKTVDNVTGITSLTVNSYDNPQHRELTRSTAFLSDGGKQATFIKYPTDFTLSGTMNSDATQALKLLQDKHIHNRPVEQYVQKWPSGSTNPLTIGASYTEFKTLGAGGTMVAVNKNYSLDINQGATNFQPMNVSGNIVNKDSRYAEKAFAKDYDSRNNLLTLRTEGDDDFGYIWGYNNTLTIAKIANKMSDYLPAFSSFEKESEGNWTFNESGVVTTDFLTGKQAFNLSYGGALPGLHVATPAGPGAPHQVVPGKYLVSYWKKNGTVTVNGSAPTLTGMTANGWTYCEHTLIDPLNFIQIGGSGLIDELRFYPAEAIMESYTYNPLVGITSHNDGSNSIILYEYDAMGRLTIERDVFGKIIKQYTYNYQITE